MTLTRITDPRHPDYAAALALYAISYVLSAVQGWIMATITQRVSKEMRSDISHKINRLPMWYYNRTTTGDVLSRVTNDVDTIGQSLNQSIGGLLSAVVLLLGSLVMMLLTNVWMTLTAVVASLLGFALMEVRDELRRVTQNEMLCDWSMVWQQ